MSLLLSYLNSQTPLGTQSSLIPDHQILPADLNSPRRPVMRLRFPLVFGMSLIVGLVNTAPAPAGNDTALAERQQNCPFGHVVTLWVEERTTITPWGAPGLETLQGGPGVHYDFGFQAGKYDTEHFILRAYPDGVTNPESTDIERFDVRSPDKHGEQTLTSSATSVRRTAYLATALRLLSVTRGLTSPAAKTPLRRDVMGSRGMRLCHRLMGKRMRAESVVLHEAALARSAAALYKYDLLHVKRCPC